MSYIADLHIHSRFSRACSPQLNIPNLVSWAKYKGINLLGTGDFLHPLWLAELKSQLKDDGSGFLTPQGVQGDSGVRFVLTVEIASMYTHGGKGRRIHNLVFMPSFESAEKFQKALMARRATLASDGRPIVGIPSKELLQMALDADEKALFVPGHLWTPWFGLFGSESGYDSLKECFEDLADYVYGIETGLSSDPAMNWRIKELDNRSILSFSDAHSLPNLGREGTVIEGDLSLGYSGLFGDIKEQKIAGTIEFHPEEGKYHYTGHRNCLVKYDPDQEIANGIICPKCGRSLTVGVMSRVEQIAGRSKAEVESQTVNRPGYKMLVPLLQIIAEALHSTPTSQKVLNEYKKLASSLGGEITVLTKAEISEISRLCGPRIAEGVDRMRKDQIVIDPGYDGVYGIVKIWPDGEKVEESKIEAPQLGLFDQV